MPRTKVLTPRPVSVDIFGTIWDIVWVEHMMHNSNTFGQTYDGLQEIHLDSNMKPMQARLTLFHELHHAILFTILSQQQERSEHDYVYVISQGLWALAKHNPELWAWMWSNNEELIQK